jgi:hypothetical protein
LGYNFKLIIFIYLPEITMKIVSLFLLVLCMSLSASAQDEDVLRPRGSNSSNARRGSSSSSSSTPMIFGIEAGLNYNMFSQTMSGLLQNSPYIMYQSGTGISPLIKFFLDVEVANNFGLQFKIAYDQKSFGRTGNGIIDCQVLGGAVTQVPVTTEYTDKITYFDITPQLRWNITPELVLLVGPTAHFQSGSTSSTSTFTIPESEQCFFKFGTANQSKTLTSTTDSSNVTSPRFGAQIDLGYKFPLTTSISLVPKIGYQYMFTPVNDDTSFMDDSRFISTGAAPVVKITDRTLHSLQFTLGLWFQL